MPNYDLKNYPLPGFHFRVDFIFSGLGALFAGPSESSFQEISGLKATLDTEDFIEPGFEGQPMGLITGRKFDNVVLKRGFTYSTKLVNWFESSLYTKEALHAPVLITALNTEGVGRGTPLVSWLLHQAYPVSYEVSGFDSMKSEYLLETVELRYSYFVQMNMKGITDIVSAAAMLV